MATKLKNRMAIAVLTLLFTFGLSSLLSLFILANSYSSKDYFQTPQFWSELEQFSGYLSVFELNDKTLEEAKKSLKIEEAGINQYRFRNGNLSEQIASIEAEFASQPVFDNPGENAPLAAKRDTEIAEITKIFNDEEYVKTKILKEKEQRLEKYYKERENYRKDFLRYQKAFLYYFTEGPKVYTNLNLASNDSATKYWSDKNTALYVTSYSLSRDHGFRFTISDDGEIIDSIFPENNEVVEGQIAVRNSANFLTEQKKEYEETQFFLIIYSSAGLLALILSLFWIKRSKALTTEVERWRPIYTKLPIDVRAVLLLGSFVAAMLTHIIVSDYWLYIDRNTYLYSVELGLMAILATVLCGVTLLQWKLLSTENWTSAWQKTLLQKGGRFGKVIYQKSVVYLDRLADSLHEAFLNRSTGTQLFIVLGTVFALGLAAIMVVIHPVFILVYLILLAVIGIPLMITIVNRIGYFNRIVEKTNELAVGKLGEDLQLTGKTALATLAGNVNVLKQGVKASENAQAKSERLKTELITNVSHDLRTPLTSIITYTELLKAEALTNEEKSAYLEIIDRKSKRLKILIDDLFEVSKMASGNIELSREKVDLVQLLQQALGEYDDMIQESTLQFRVTNPESPLCAWVDGQKFWRVFDNVIGNILKYSLENSRVYIAIVEKDDQAVITFKNISKYEMSDNSDELFERFKRGDTSRHTEGSGLGLAIAKSIIDLHDGTLDIETDGDLFKVMILLNILD
ncbi:histidine kinase dimerization/phospho-acceptor domain-containing protein [Bacillus sp. OK048]|uniref:sensor histidine kinase n=1 Tax=Bacillus sp. OK048 TaxID=1882761 RepID=UPI00088434BF|nr:histidine kinase dimerization/phospho-acceptor domain-containing protein [Bacillus sp. OK048]SDM86881.1 Signal transduction histidine kinase [Bacillus sp. OK048]